MNRVPADDSTSNNERCGWVDQTWRQRSHMAKGAAACTLFPSPCTPILACASRVADLARISKRVLAHLPVEVLLKLPIVNGQGTVFPAEKRGH